MERRDFLVRTGLALGAASLAAARRSNASALTGQPSLDNWQAVRDQFDLTRDQMHFALFFLAAHPAPVREAIERHRRGLDANPIGYFMEQAGVADADVLTAASDYLGVSPTDIALTDSTTMGLGLLYGGMTLRRDQEILTTFHDHYSTEMSLRHRARRGRRKIVQIALYKEGGTATEQEILGSLMRALKPSTRVVAVTWVHSGTGVKLPIRAIADVLETFNRNRDPLQRALLCVDGVHGLGIDNVTLPELGCDFFIAGTHKWMYGPRGTGLVWGRPDAWPVVNPIIPPFHWDAIRIWMKRIPPKEIPPGRMMTPGGFHSFEHRWSVGEAFRFHQAIGQARVAQRVHELNRQLKEGLAAMNHVTLHTPMSDKLSAGIVCFEVDGLEPREVVERFAEHRIIASTSPYATSYVRLAPCIVNSPSEVDAALRVVHALA